MTKKRTKILTPWLCHKEQVDVLPSKNQVLCKLNDC